MSQVTNIRKVTVFGGTGFLGRRVVQHLLDHGFAVRVASRHPERSAQVFSNTSSALEFVRADVGDEGSVMTAVAGAFGVVNVVSLYVERGNQTFRSVHVEAAARVAKHSRALGVQAWYMFLGSVPMPDHRPPTFAAAARVKVAYARHSLPRRSSALRSCSDPMMRF